MRCMGCNKILTNAELNTINANSGLHEDRCKQCMPVDTGIIWHANQEKPIGFLNEVVFEPRYVGGAGDTIEENDP